MNLSSTNSVILTVAELNRRAKTLLENGFPLLWVAGEISNFKRYDSGHCYFSLKDANAQVRCVMFRNRASLIDFQPREGMQVEARALVSLYEARGDFQLTIEALRPAGLGALFAAYEKLKQKLESEGLFASSRKKALPVFPRAIGIVTSPAAAALSDVIAALKRRMPGLPIILYPSPVQGLDAAPQIASAIHKANERKEVDVLIVCRGGGSLEDLWAFNEEIVARAIAACDIPVVSGVGHETDFSIADFVADVRAATPTAAAELVSPNRSEWLAKLARQQGLLHRSIERLLQRKMQETDSLSRRLQHPGERLRQQKSHLQALSQRLHLLPVRTLEKNNYRLKQLSLNLSHLKPRPEHQQAQLQHLSRQLLQAMPRLIEQRRQKLAMLTARLEPWNPQSVLARGYALVSRRDGQIVRHGAQLSHGEALSLQFADSAVEVRVTKDSERQGTLEI
ncbi:exodeoxyribonuclease VII large subunit [Iodobacter sp. LRB]|uniref:exodeoxyribonuclease VII large subunit n=1 Tax=unclassified Iodobacter TaxID=235634 RepID=UPI000C0E5B2E|nr:exodeoxyribonuclease VII large subunit [Iodobacter sp. BJB302]PHV00331.1 exodeoxyribonuclease VII large subunit [Iodobacter sp. BJB302]